MDRRLLPFALLLAACGGTSSTPAGDAGVDRADVTLAFDPDASAIDVGSVDVGNVDVPLGDVPMDVSTSPDVETTDVAVDAGTDTGVDVPADNGIVADAGQTDTGTQDVIVDTGAVDVVATHDVPVDTGTGTDAATLACGSTSCNPLTQYCFMLFGGAIRPDGSTAGSMSCNALPTACVATPTCACVHTAASGCYTSCTDVGGVVVTCDAP